jgi:hydroxymethylglutaryl-CoA lyase
MRRFSTVVASNLPSKVRILEAGARDGLQNVKKSISVEDKVKFLCMLEDAGLRYIEGGAFVSAKWIPQVRGLKNTWSSISNYGYCFRWPTRTKCLNS